MNKKLRNLCNSAACLRRAINFFGPYLGAGIAVTHLATDFSEATVQMKLRWYNTNYVGTHFGGSLYSMTDPIYMLLLMKRLGPDYIVWDKAARIDFLKPGRGVVTARFVLPEAIVERLRDDVAGGEKALPEWSVDVMNQAGDVVARVHKTLYVRRKR